MFIIEGTAFFTSPATFNLPRKPDYYIVNHKFNNFINFSRKAVVSDDDNFFNIHCIFFFQFNMFCS